MAVDSRQKERSGDTWNHAKQDGMCLKRSGGPKEGPAHPPGKETVAVDSRQKERSGDTYIYIQLFINVHIYIYTFRSL